MPVAVLLFDDQCYSMAKAGRKDNNERWADEILCRF